MESDSADSFEQGTSPRNTKDSGEMRFQQESNSESFIDAETNLIEIFHPNSSSNEMLAHNLFSSTQSSYGKPVHTANFPIQSFPFYQLHTNPSYLNQQQFATFLVPPPHNQPYSTGSDNISPFVQFTPVYQLPNQNQLYYNNNSTSQRSYKNDGVIPHIAQHDSYNHAHQNPPFILNNAALPFFNHQIVDNNLTQNNLDIANQNKTVSSASKIVKEENATDAITHNTDIQQKASKTKNRKAKVVHCCSECGKHFKRKQSLLTHMNIHLNLRPFRCFICGKTFNAKQNYMRHERLHLQKRAPKKDEKNA